MSQLFLFFRLSWLCAKLCLYLLFFSWQVLWTKLNKRYLIVFFICLCILGNLFTSIIIWQQKETPTVSTINSTIKYSKNQLSIFDQKTLTLNISEMQELINNHQLLEKQGVINQAVYINLSQLTQFFDQNQTGVYLQKIKKITPQTVE